MRVIHYSNQDGSKEGVFFTEDTDVNAEDILPPGCKVHNDFAFDGDDFPSDFPLDYNLEK